MPNILLNTENFGAADWYGTASVTTNTHAAPPFAGGSAGMADTIEDSDDGSALHYRQDADIPNDSSSWVASIYIRKDANTARFVGMLLWIFFGGTSVLKGVQFDTQNGTVSDWPGAAPAAKGVEDVDANWWRVWWRVENNGTGNVLARLDIYPAATNEIGVDFVGATTGSIVVWGANLINTTTLQNYDPHPSYQYGLTSDDNEKMSFIGWELPWMPHLPRESA